MVRKLGSVKLRKDTTPGAFSPPAWWRSTSIDSRVLGDSPLVTEQRHGGHVISLRRRPGIVRRCDRHLEVRIDTAVSGGPDAGAGSSTGTEREADGRPLARWTSKRTLTAFQSPNTQTRAVIGAGLPSGSGH